MRRQIGTQKAEKLLQGAFLYITLSDEGRMAAASQHKPQTKPGQSLIQHWAYQILHADDALEHSIRLGVVRLVVDNAGAVDQKDAFHERDILPHLGLTRDGGHLAHLRMCS